jgi:hypothetical protein
MDLQCHAQLIILEFVIISDLLRINLKMNHIFDNWIRHRFLNSPFIYAEARVSAVMNNRHSNWIHKAPL